MQCQITATRHPTRSLRLGGEFRRTEIRDKKVKERCNFKGQIVLSRIMWLAYYSTTRPYSPPKFSLVHLHPRGVQRPPPPFLGHVHSELLQQVVGFDFRNQQVD